MLLLFDSPQSTDLGPICNPVLVETQSVLGVTPMPTFSLAPILIVFASALSSIPVDLNEVKVHTLVILV